MWQPTPEEKADAKSREGWARFTLAIQDLITHFALTILILSLIKMVEMYVGFLWSHDAIWMRESSIPFRVEWIFNLADAANIALFLLCGTFMFTKTLLGR
jgi:hypothetical protein